ncbi:MULTISPECIES: hypothetical protein [unclassified Sinorhizobium]|uniref:hypothetical protein n=1 Tax=unclassified Sinorhizobium TaxID=2613772 RepID=UPI0024C3B401|nr:MULTISPECIES: hypothetical protein [unclassified Sinorhizobium]MDK1376770.1 hypothetical protein [Sinorhizobium sp. 6-70]MDK1479542.1 hypothetical protein [Sinorhizobium sp. 6-117]
MEDKVEAARQRYNELYPDRPIKQIGDTPDVYYYLVMMRGVWENGTPLSDRQIKAVEAITPPGCFS